MESVQTRGRRRFVAIAIAIAACAIALGACGSDDSAVSSSKVPIFSGDPTAKTDPSTGELTDLPALTRRAEAPHVPTIRGSEGQDVAQWVATVNNDVASFWQALFNQNGLQFQPANQILFSGEPTETACGQISADNGPLYCTGDQTIYLPISFFQDVLGGVSSASDASIAMAIAHESAHHVQNLLGTFDQGLRTIDTELQADCMAGVWGTSVLQRGALEDDDLIETLGFVHVLGDPDTVRADEPGAHGTPDQRVQAYKEGFDSGAPGTCEGIGERIAPKGGGGAEPGSIG